MNTAPHLPTNLIAQYIDLPRYILGMTWIALITFFACLSQDASAKTNTYRLDDSLTQPGIHAVQARWLSRAPSRAAQDHVEASVRVKLILDTKPYSGKSARVYMVRPKTLLPIEVSWSTGGVLRNGRIDSSVPRALLWSGVVNSLRLVDTLDVRVLTDGRTLTQSTALEFTYEIDVDE